MRSRSEYARVGLTVFVTAAGILLFYDTLFGSRVLPGLAGRFIGAIAPVLIGMFLAYMLTPMVNFVEHLFFRARVERAREQGRSCAPGVRALTVALVWLFVLVVVYLLLSVLLPELYKSVTLLAGNLETYYGTLSGWVQMLFERFPEVETWVSVRLQDAYDQIVGFVSGALSQVQTIMAAAGRGVVSVFNFLKDLLVGIIVSVYLMLTKEVCAASARKVCCSILSRKDVEWLLRAVRRADEIFSGFVRGKILDSLIIGALCFLGASILRFPYTSLVSVFIGVTNIIPFFGPFIGAVPSAFLILLVSPVQALYFVIFILVLQQLDGNVIGPKILGGQTGLSSLWVIVAILIGGSFFGIPGMFFGVPVLACLYSAGTFFIEERLMERGMPTAVTAYAPGKDPSRWSEDDPPPEGPGDPPPQRTEGGKKGPLRVRFLRRDR